MRSHVLAAGALVLAAPIAIQGYSGTANAQVFASAPTSASGWTVQARGIGFNGLTCPATGICLAIGSDAAGNGVVATTANAGKTWTYHPLPTGTPPLASVSCADASHCWATASALGAATSFSLVHGIESQSATLNATNSTQVASDVLATSDGGTTWVTEKVPTGIDALGAISCPTTQDCWTVGVSGLSAGTAGLGASILSTSDGGTTWKRVTDPEPPALLAGISCPDAMHCIATGGTVSTSTASQTVAPAILAMGPSGSWSVLSTRALPPSIAQSFLAPVICTSDSTCALAALQPSGQQGAAVIAETSDGGSTWSASTLPTSNGYVSALACPSTTQCWVAVDNNIYISHGTSWLAQAVSPSGTSIRALSCTSASQCTAASENPDGTPASWSTTDGGSTWSTAPIGQALPDVQAISCPSITTCWAVGGGNTSSGGAVVVASKDGGGTWTAQTAPAHASALSAVSCPNNTHCWAAGGTSMISTIDGGTKWTAQSVPVGTNTFDSIDCPDTMHCFATAESPPGFGATGPFGNGLILSTSDGGSTWRNDLLPDSTGPLTSISCPSGLVCVATTGSAINSLFFTFLTLFPGALSSGSTGQILVTSNGGATWDLAELPAGLSGVGGVSCPSSGACFAAASSDNGFPSVIASHDGGRSWSVVGVPSGAGVLSFMVCPTITACYAPSVPGIGQSIVTTTVMFGSADRSERAQHTSVHTEIPSFFPFPTDGGSVLATTDAGATWNEETLPANGTVLSSLACPDATHCIGIANSFIGFFSAAPGGMILSTKNGGAGATASLPTTGYAAADTAGDVFPYGSAEFLGSEGTIHLAKPIVGMAATPSGRGYWLVASDGGVFTFGDAGFFGSAGGTPLSRSIVGMAATPSGHGYWLSSSDGGVFTFGDAGFFGSAGNLPLQRPIVGMAATPDAKGYWLVASDGGIFTYGDANFFGSAGSLSLMLPATGMAATPDGKGYWIVAADGGIFNYGDAGFFGSVTTTGAPGGAQAIVPTSDGQGYWEMGGAGTVTAYGDASALGSPASTTGELGFFGNPIVAGIAWPHHGA